MHWWTLFGILFMSGIVSIISLDILWNIAFICLLSGIAGGLGTLYYLAAKETRHES